MRILISAVTYYPTVGGADDFVRSIAEGAAARGHDVLVVASDLLQHVAGIRLKDSGEALVNGVRVVRCRSVNLPGHIYPVWPGLFAHVRRFKPDVIHGFGLGYWSADAAALYRKKIPVIVSPTGGRYRSGRLYGVLQRLFSGTREVPWTALSLSEKEALRAPLMLAPSIMPEEWLGERPDPFPHIPKGRRVLFVGRLCRDKGIFDLLAAKPATDSQVILAGPDYGAGEIQVMEGVHRVGALEREKLVAAYQHADVVVLPSYHEGFGIVLLEAMAAAKPVIAYDNTSMPELVRHGENGLLVKTGDIEGLAAGINALLADGKEYGIRGRARAFKDYGRNEMVSRAIAHYRAALARH